MAGALTFVVPVKHQTGISDLDGTMARLRETLDSVEVQASSGADAVVVANEGCPLPTLPPSASVVRVDLPFRELPPGGPETRAERHRAIQQDKGSRVLAGLRWREPPGHVMVLDFDDFVSRHLTDFVSSRPEEPGWYVQTGWAYSGGRWAARLRDFHLYCGTSLILHRRLLKEALGEPDPDPGWIRSWLGSHRFVVEHLRGGPDALAPLPFEAAAYRVGHTDSTSGLSKLSRFFFRPRNLGFHPVRAATALGGLRSWERLREDFGQ